MNGQPPNNGQNLTVVPTMSNIQRFHCIIMCFTNLQLFSIIYRSGVTIVTALLVLYTSIATATNYDHYYQNKWDGSLFVQCKKGEALYKVKSEHHNYYEDRRWRWECRQVSRSEYI